ncbi:Protein of unknown function [Jannaschia faecimaris]|uniref:DUF3108 domain-containing protein n=1 Tax=Jannaschia faecimaris TaxID=1244108 RepID=A0A1H3MMJ0_9RHOB|nr:DUF3108 domain-containing protein [Jannaschia faecimaris]SDY77693.1 Protein of unknown function [Jannaschia faecimaris]
MPFRLFAAAFTILTALPAFAQSTLDAKFDVSFRGIVGGQIAISANEKGGAYVVSAQGRPTGVIGAIVEYQYDGTARGIVRGGRHAVTTYEEQELDSGELTGAKMRFRNGRPTGVTFDPPRAPEPHDIDPTAQSGVIDTLSALYLMVRATAPDRACNQRYDLFDGRHVSRLTLGAAQVGDDGTISCAAEYLRLRGYTPEEMTKRSRVPMTVIYGPADFGRVQVTEIRATSRLGDAVLRRR